MEQNGAEQIASVTSIFLWSLALGRPLALDLEEILQLHEELAVGERPALLSLVMFADGDELAVSAGAGGVRFLLVSGKPIGSRSPGGAPS